MAYLSQVDKYYGLPAATLERIKRSESGLKMDPMITSSKGAGLWQFLPQRASQYGVDSTEPIDSARGAGAYMRDLLQKYHNDLAKAVAAYNTGPGNLDRIIAQHPNDWQRFVCKETRDYLTRFGPPEGVRIVIEDKIGGSVNVSAAALAATAP